MQKQSTPTIIATSSQSDTPTMLGRRAMLSQIGLAGLGWLASGSLADAFGAFSQEGMPSIHVPTKTASSLLNGFEDVIGGMGLPDEWREANEAQAAQYLRYLNTLKLQRVNPAQVLESHAKAKGRVWNKIPPKAWWNRMGYTLRIVDRVAKELNVHEVEVISAYRCPAYNARCRGAKSGSCHQENMAADVKFPIRASVVTATARRLRDHGLFRGGIGGYWNFTHIDSRGTNMNW